MTEWSIGIWTFWPIKFPIKNKTNFLIVAPSNLVQYFSAATEYFCPFAV